MLPRSVTCEECGSRSAVRGYGRIEYEWGDGQLDFAAVKIRSIRLTIDCPQCGVRTQDHYPSDELAATGNKPPRPIRGFRKLVRRATPRAH